MKSLAALCNGGDENAFIIFWQLQQEKSSGSLLQGWWKCLYYFFDNFNMKSLAALYDVGDENAFIFITSFVIDCWIFVETGPATTHRLDVILHAV